MPQRGLMGRERELARLDAAIERARGGRCVVLEMAGEPGMGKTSILRAFADRATSRHMSVLTGRASRFEQARPYGLFVDSITRADGLVYTHIDAARGSGVLDGPARFDACGAVANLLAASSGEHGTLLCLDDVHWADSSSLSLLRNLLRDPPEVPLVVACAYRPRQAPALLVACLAEIADRHATERLDLAPLDREASDALLGPAVEPTRRASLYQMSGGNPLYLRILAALPAGPGGDRIARAAWSALLGEMAAVEPEHVAALRAAALLGDPFDATLLPTTADLDADVAFGALDELTAADLVRPGVGEPPWFRFRHPLVRGLVLLQTPMLWRTAAHRRASEALRAGGSSVVERAPHIAASARSGDVTAARDLLEAAERVAAADSATAVAWLRAASRLLPTEAESSRALRRDVLSALLRVLVATGQWEQCRSASSELLKALGADHGARRIAAVTFHALLERSLGDVPTARMLLEAELSAAPGSSASPGAADPLRLGLARACLAQGQIADARRALDGYAASRFASASTLALAAAYAGEVSELRSHTDAAVSVLDALTDDTFAGDLDSLAHLAWAEALGERGDSARRHFVRGLGLGVRTAHSLLTPYLLLGHAYSAITTGSLREAVRSAEMAATVGGESGRGDLAGFAHALHAWAVVYLDGPEAAVAMAERALREIGGYGRLRAGAVAILALIHLGQGRPVECVELVRSIGEREFDRGPLRCVAPMLHGLASVASSALGENAEAAAWAERAHDAGSALGLPGQQGYALLASAVGASDPQAAAHTLTDAVSRFEDGGLVLMECQARLLLAQKLVTLRRLDEAAAEVGRAKGRADACGARYLWRRGTDVQRRIGAARSRRGEPGAAAVSAREAQIIRLVCLGKSNQEIGAELFVSAKTVEAHLTQIFRRLGVRSRVELIARAVAIALAADD